MKHITYEQYFCLLFHKWANFVREATEYVQKYPNDIYIVEQTDYPELSDAFNPQAELHEECWRMLKNLLGRLGYNCYLKNNILFIVKKEETAKNEPKT